MPIQVAERLITSDIPFKITSRQRLVVEDVETKRKRPVTRVTGLFQRADYKNANGRIYPRPVLAKAVEDLQESVKARRVLGELSHPSDASIHLDRASHLITKVWMEGNDVFGECEVLEEMPCGKMLKGLLDSDVCISVSSRGVGDIKSIHEGEQEVSEVQPGYKIVCWDVVIEPSVANTELRIMESKILNLRKQHEMELTEEVKELFKQGGRFLDL